jgi:hypothetical protein
MKSGQILDSWRAFKQFAGKDCEFLTTASRYFVLLSTEYIRLRLTLILLRTSRREGERVPAVGQCEGFKE